MADLVDALAQDIVHEITVDELSSEVAHHREM